MIPNRHPILVLLLCCACGASSPAVQTGIMSIDFGSGGGFTGAVMVYRLNESGQLMKMENGDLVPIKNVDKRQLNEILSKAAAFKAYSYQVPDNIYYYLKIKSSDGENYIVWAFGSDKIDAGVVALHTELMTLITQ